MIRPVVARWWIDTPIRLRRWSPLLSAAWADGFYLTAWPIAALLLPALALLVGFVEGATHWSFQTLGDGGPYPIPALAFVQMTSLLYVAAITGAFSAQLGLLLVIGFAIGDWLLFVPMVPSNPNLSGLDRFLQLGLPQLISYLLFFMLAAQPTLTARILAGSMDRVTRLSGSASFWVSAALVAVLQGVIVYAWTMAAPMVIRPIWMWMWTYRGFPVLTVPYFTQVINPGLPAAVASAVLIRAMLTWLARKNETVKRNAERLVEAFSEADQHPAFTRRLSPWMGATLSALVVTLLLAGFIATLSLGIVMFAIIAAILVGRAIALPKIPGWTGWTVLAGKIPLLFRWLGVIVGGYLIAQLVYLTPGAAVEANTVAGAFGPELVCIVLGLIVAVLLLPGGKNTPGSPVRLPRLGIGPSGMAQATAAVLLLVGLFTTRPALAYCADSTCCFVSNSLAILAMAAFVLFLSLLLFPEFALAEAIAAEAESAATEGVGWRPMARLFRGLELTKFRTFGMSNAEINSFLEGPSGMRFLSALAKASPSTSEEVIQSRAIEILGSGTAAPESMIVDFPLVKLVPEGGGVTPYSPYFTTQLEIDQAAGANQSFTDAFGLPVSSGSSRYSLYQISPLEPTEVWYSNIARTFEMDGPEFVSHSGTARQYIVPNRTMWTDPNPIKIY